MTTNYPACCPICGNPVKYDNDYLEHTLMESSSECKVCGLWKYESVTGYVSVWIGYCTFSWGWDAWRNPDWFTGLMKEMQECERETMRMWANPEFGNWLHVRGVWPENDTTLFLVHADWLQEQGYFRQEEGVRGLVRDCSR